MLSTTILSISLAFNCLSFDSQIKDKCESLKDIKSFVSFIRENNFTEEQNIRAITLFVCQKIEYPTDAKAHQLSKDPNEIVASKEGVCYEYCIVFKAICDSLGVKCETIVGITNEHYSYYQQTKKLGYAHAWNIVYVDGLPNLIDVTWCDESSRIDEQWYLADPTEFILTHYPLGKAIMVMEYYLLERFEAVYHCDYLLVVNNCREFKDECRANNKYQLLNKPLSFKRFNGIK